MDFALSPENEDFRQRVRDFVAAEMLPLEGHPANFDEHQRITPEALAPVRATARDQGLWALPMPKDRGGQGLDTVGMAACYEEMARSPFGPMAFNCAAPDDGTMLCLNKILDEGADAAAEILGLRAEGKVHDRPP